VAPAYPRRGTASSSVEERDRSLVDPTRQLTGGPVPFDALCRGPDLNRRHMVLQVTSPTIHEIRPQLDRDDAWL